MHDRTREIVALALQRVMAREGRRCEGPDAAAAPAGPGATAGGAAPSGVAPGPAPSDTRDPLREGPGTAGTPGDVCLASDHGGFALKEALVQALREHGYRVRDLGPPTADSCDFPDYALRVARAVALGEAWRGIMVDAIGTGSGMACNKVPGVRAATCFDVRSAHNARAHNDANVMCIGSLVLEPPQALEVCRRFLDTAFEGGRHARRVAKIDAIERTFTAPVLAALEALP